MSLSRLLSAAVAVSGLIAAVTHFDRPTVFSYFLFAVVMLWMIWFPDVVNSFTEGSWVDGYRMNPTPPALIAAFGWAALIAVNCYIFGLF